ncbi:hypothetical protein C471_03493 [Halorubrum saccharovorum DSM 1137]|uniref:DUF1684 domain-containing protein n=1 Tax=Halorubrum saccharovorum DSM 1137 TaxID=1227484 RepID=M0E402_9EURY|nr:DUF1684 domain-containing protein [Halorubrum saccharovorum]ELZ42490.1 hypothetical protein C471_03493 [Halorubrum saccharovorum DSM 1137]
MTETSPDDDWAAQIEAQRRAKREHFRDSPRSPLPASMRGDDFPGLAYFDPDPAYRFALSLHEHDEKETVTVETTADGEQTYRRWGEFRFEVDGESVTLQAYRPTDGGDRFWVPFRDETNGEATYGAGRYLDLEPDRDRVDGEWVVDFNVAYNPTCAYNHAYECPLIPMENWLDVAIEAGEKEFPAAPAGADR